MDRRSFISGTIAAGLASLLPTTMSVAKNTPIDAKSVLKKFTSIKGMSGEFIQFDNAGNQTEGMFHIQRPGYARFDYRGKKGLNILADGKSLAVENKKLKTWTLYPLNRTPLYLILSDHLDLSNGFLQYVIEKEGAIAVRLGDKEKFGDASIELLLDKNTGELRQWTLTDHAKQQTTVVVHEMKINQPIPRSIFKIPYSEIRRT